jgi:transposase-like protein
MGKHHTEDYKLSAVKYALRTDNQVETCEVFDCKRSSLQDWLKLYEEIGSPVRALNFTLKKCRFEMPASLSF